jgi:peptide/nickel transport system permease protein
VIGYLIRRVIQAIIVTLIVTIITFVLLHLVPGGEVRAILGIRASPAEIAADSKLWGFDQAVRRYSALDHIVTGIGFVGYGSPTFFVGLLLVQWFAIDLHIFPAFAPQATSLGGILSDPVALILPVATYAFVAFALWSRFMRSSVLDNIVQDYVRTARAKGASNRRVLWGHIFRNSLITIVTLLGLQLPVIIGGAIFIEYVFNYPGMGLLFFQSAVNTDIQMMLAITVITTILTIVGNLLADIGYAMLDPRVRYS